MSSIKTDTMKREETRRKTIVWIYLRRFSVAKGITEKIAKDIGKTMPTARKRVKCPWDLTVEELRRMKPTKEEVLTIVFGE